MKKKKRYFNKKKSCPKKTLSLKVDVKKKTNQFPWNQEKNTDKSRDKHRQEKNTDKSREKHRQNSHLIIHCPTNEGVSKMSKRVNERASEGTSK